MDKTRNKRQYISAGDIVRLASLAGLAGILLGVRVPVTVRQGSVSEGMELLVSSSA